MEGEENVDWERMAEEDQPGLESRCEEILRRYAGGGALEREMLRPEEAFELLEQLEVPEGFDAIDDQCFAGSFCLQAVKLPETVREVGDGAFDGCTSLTVAVFGGGVERIGDRCFAGCQELCSCGAGGVGALDLPDSLVEIGAEAFRFCSCVKRVVLPYRLEGAGAMCFADCFRLESVTVPAGCLLGKNCFARHSIALKEVVFEGRTLDEVRKMRNYPWGISRPDEVIQATGGILAEAVDGRQADLKARCEAALRAALLGSEDGSLDIDDTKPEEDFDAVYDLDIPEGFTSLDGGVFSGRALRRVGLPESLVEIGSCAFDGCHDLVEVKFGEHVKTIGKWAFSSCERLCEGDGVLQLPDSLLVLGSQAFGWCDSVREVALPPRLQTIGQMCFISCESLARVTVPRSVEYIGFGAFYYCYALEEVSFEGRTMDEVRKMPNYPWKIPDTGKIVALGGLLAE